MKNKLPAIKVYDIDYSFIIKNYLNPEMWQKTWTLFQYKTWVITFRIDYIWCRSEKIHFMIKIKDNSPENEYKYGDYFDTDKDYSADVDYSLKIDNIQFLKREIISKSFYIIEKLEEEAIMATREYANLTESYSDEKNKLTKIAKDFLDDNGVNNEDIRNAYIDSYVCNNTKLDLMQEKLKREMLYTIFPDLYLMFANATEDDKIVQKWEETLAGNNNIEELRTEILEYLEYMQSEDFEDDMNSNLEEI